MFNICVESSIFRHCYIRNDPWSSVLISNASAFSGHGKSSNNVSAQDMEQKAASDFYRLNKPSFPGTRYAISRLNGSRSPGRQLIQYRAPSVVLTALWGACGTQRGVGSDNRPITPPAQGGEEGGVSDFDWLKTPPVPSVAPCQRCGISFEQFPRPWQKS